MCASIFCIFWLLGLYIVSWKPLLAHCFESIFVSNFCHRAFQIVLWLQIQSNCLEQLILNYGRTSLCWPVQPLLLTKPQTKTIQGSKRKISNLRTFTCPLSQGSINPTDPGKNIPDDRSCRARLNATLMASGSCVLAGTVALLNDNKSMSQGDKPVSVSNRVFRCLKIRTRTRT